MLYFLLWERNSSLHDFFVMNWKIVGAVGIIFSGLRKYLLLDSNEKKCCFFRFVSTCKHKKLVLGILQSRLLNAPGAWCAMQLVFYDSNPLNPWLLCMAWTTVKHILYHASSVVPSSGPQLDFVQMSLVQLRGTLWIDDSRLNLFNGRWGKR